MRRAVITGSFDPITSGHLDLIRRSAELFDELYVVIVFNAEKKSGMFSPSDRLTLLKTAVDELGCPNIHADMFSGLTSDYIHSVGAKFIVRGARNAVDYDYEYDLSLIMKRFDPEFETLIIPSSPEYLAISSTYVRELLKYGCDLGDAVPQSCRELMRDLYEAQKSI